MSNHLVSDNIKYETGDLASAAGSTLTNFHLVDHKTQNITHDTT